MTKKAYHTSAPTLAEGDTAPVYDAVQAWLDEHPDCPLDELQREALARIVGWPWEVATVAEACQRVAAILEALGSDEQQRAHVLIDFAVQRAREAARA